MQAIVIGGSFAGLLAARVLSDFAERVRIFERDVRIDTVAARKGVPQGKHVHGLLAGGLDVLKELFPGIVDELAEAGARTVDLGYDCLWFNNGAWRLRSRCGVSACAQTRPLLEFIVRRRIASIGNIKCMWGGPATGLEFDSAKMRVTGVRAQSGHDESFYPADLIVDCSGRGSKLPTWLGANGLQKPASTEIPVHVGYSTRHFRVESVKTPDWTVLLILAQAPKGTRMGVGMNVEAGELQVTLGGLFRDYPPDEEAGFMRFAESLENAELFRAIRHAKPVSPIVTHRFPSHLWTRYDKLQSLPANLLVLGDAMCSFNPIYGQGMSVAALEAQALRRCLAEFQNNSGDFSRVRDGYFRQAANAVKAAWVMATGADLSYPQAAEFREVGHGVINRYIGHVIALSSYDKKALTTWNQVTNMQRPLSALFAPPLIGRVVRRMATGGPPMPVQEPIRG